MQVHSSRWQLCCAVRLVCAVLSCLRHGGCVRGVRCACVNPLHSSRVSCSALFAFGSARLVFARLLVCLLVSLSALLVSLSALIVSLSALIVSLSALLVSLSALLTWSRCLLCLFLYFACSFRGNLCGVLLLCGSRCVLRVCVRLRGCVRLRDCSVLVAVLCVGVLAGSCVCSFAVSCLFLEFWLCAHKAAKTTRPMGQKKLLQRRHQRAKLSNFKMWLDS